MNTEKKIASYEDACRVLNIQPINEEVFNIFPKEDQRSMLAYHKLTVITRALNNGWKPNWDDQNEWKYYPLFRYVNAGLSCATTSAAASNALASLGSRLCFPTSALAKYAAEHFADLYRDYYCFASGNGETQQAESNQEEPQSDFLKTTTEVMQKHLVPFCNGSSSRGLIVVGCDTDTKDKNGEGSTGVMVGFCGNYGAIIKGLKELLTGKQSAPIVERATREIAFEKMIKGGGIESFLKDIMNNN